MTTKSEQTLRRLIREELKSSKFGNLKEGSFKEWQKLANDAVTKRITIPDDNGYTGTILVEYNEYRTIISLDKKNRIVLTGHQTSRLKELLQKIA